MLQYLYTTEKIDLRKGGGGNIPPFTPPPVTVQKRNFVSSSFQ